MISIIIPCYNEEKTIGKVIADVKKYLPDAVIYVYNNNSSDKTEEIARAVEEVFGVKVVKVNTMHVTGKLKRTGRYPAGRRPSWKKAVVTLSDDSKSIEFFEGMA